MDILSYLLGLKSGEKKGKGEVEIESDYIFTDPNSDGNIVVTKEGE